MPGMLAANRSFEKWLRGKTDVDERALRHKHTKMKHDPFQFLRATYFRWAEQFPIVCPELEKTAPPVNAVGDIHIENFGTWRDAEGRLCWGVNDFDEACELPFASDLVRLLTSGMFAWKARTTKTTPEAQCAAILDGYRYALKRKAGAPVIIAGEHQWLYPYAIDALQKPEKFWAKLRAESSKPKGKSAGELEKVYKILRAQLPSDVQFEKSEVRERETGTGSLGRRRFLYLFDSFGETGAREIKAMVPSAWCWAMRRAARRSQSAILKASLRSPDPFLKMNGDWSKRRLAPDSRKIEMESLSHDMGALFFKTMGLELANIHLGTPSLDRTALQRALLSPEMFMLFARRMYDAVEADYKAYKK
jgi:hypothetical protein